MRTALAHADLFLRGGGPFLPERAASRPGWWLPLMVVAFSPIYGAFMGSYEFASAERLLMMTYSGVKVPLLLFATTALCLPGFFVLNTVLGLRDDFREAVHAVLAGQAGLSIALASLASADLASLKAGQAVAITTDATTDKLTGTVASVGIVATG